MTLWLVRHAQPLIAPGICYGQLDVGADIQATGESARALRDVLPKTFRMVSSPLQRCEQLAQALIGLQPDLSYKTDARLKEMDFGNWEGRSWAEIAKPEVDAWTANFATYPVGQTGESVAQFMARVAQAFDALPRDTDTLWVTHAGVIRAAQLLARGVRHIERADQWPKPAPAFGQWCKLGL